MNVGAISWYSGGQAPITLCTVMAKTMALTKVVVKVKNKQQFYLIYNAHK